VIQFVTSHPYTLYSIQRGGGALGALRSSWDDTCPVPREGRQTRSVDLLHRHRADAPCRGPQPSAAPPHTHLSRGRGHSGWGPPGSPEPGSTGRRSLSPLFFSGSPRCGGGGLGFGECSILRFSGLGGEIQWRSPPAVSPPLVRRAASSDGGAVQPPRSRLSADLPLHCLSASVPCGEF